jgi:hypothetical protein
MGPFPAGNRLQGNVPSCASDEKSNRFFPDRSQPLNLTLVPQKAPSSLSPEGIMVIRAFNFDDSVCLCPEIKLPFTFNWATTGKWSEALKSELSTAAGTELFAGLAVMLLL